MIQPLKKYNSFHVDAKAKKFRLISDLGKLHEWRTENPGAAFYILGEGSNTLFVKDPDEWILKNELKGKQIIKETPKHIYLKVASGENWHKLVEWAVSENYGGIENLALIPGSVGAAPVQNIGAYGVEFKDRAVQVEYLDMQTGKISELDTPSCEYGYRNSIFKSKLKSKVFILSVVLKLSKVDHQINIRYGAISDKLKESGIVTAGIRDVFNVVVAIRNSKLPDPDVLGNAGSFFKNPVISGIVYNQLESKYPNIPNYDAGDNNVKLAAGWLIEKAGWKAKTFGGVSTYEKQALVIVNQDNASGLDIYNYAQMIKAAVFAKFGIVLEEEVNIIM